MNLLGKIKLILIFCLLLIPLILFSQTEIDDLKKQLDFASGKEKIEILDYLQEAYWDIFPEASIEYGQQALKLARKLNDDRQEALELINIGQAYFVQEDYTKAIRNYTLGMDLAEKIGDKFLMIEQYINISVCYLKLNNEVKSIEFALIALDICDKSDNTKGYIGAYKNLGDIYFQKKDIADAIGYYQLAIDAARKLDDMNSVSNIQKKIGVCFLASEEKNRAIDFFKQAAAYFETTNALKELVICYKALGLLYEKQGDKINSDKFDRKLLEIEKQLLEEEEIDRYLFYYEYYNVLGYKDKALEHYQKYNQLLNTYYVKKSHQEMEIIQQLYEQEKQILEKDITETDSELEKIQSESKEKEQEIKALKTVQEEREEQIRLEKAKKEELRRNLKYEQEINNLKLLRKNQERNLFIISSILFLIIMIVIFNRLRFNVKVNAKLNKQNKFILKVSDQLKNANNKLEKANKELKRAKEKLEKIARTDPLTHLSNRRDILEKMNYEKDRFERNAKPFTIVISDIDNFKSVNDNYGHYCGDHVLKTISKLFTSSLRKQDICARWGGEEFLLFLPETNLEGGLTISEKIRKEIANTKIKYKDVTLKITMTFGVCVYNQLVDINKCILKADKALYKGKHSGKNKVLPAKL
ncbi:MAG: diguanylate cyclase [Candidatus Cloacimonetes bacterium]|nr:diguanylate cyclase [Candidatus Cloacimonadota bacterium]MBL7149626.1 diguanylate cyclase [Candidatus Cloacimonadota bacterium]